MRNKTGPRRDRNVPYHCFTENKAQSATEGRGGGSARVLTQLDRATARSFRGAQKTRAYNISEIRQIGSPLDVFDVSLLAGESIYFL